MTGAGASPVPGLVSTLPTERRQRLGDVVGSEIVRATTIRSTWWILLLGFVLGVVSAVATGFLDGTTVTSVCINVGAVAVSAAAVFGVLSITDEYSLGTLIASVSATPRRGRLLTAKLLVALGFGVVVSIVPMLVAVGILALTRGGGLPIGPTGTFAPIGLAIATVIIAVFSVFLGTLVRNSTVGVTLALALVFLVPVLGFRLGESPFFLPDLGISDAASSMIVPFSGYFAFHVLVIAVWIVLPAVFGSRLFVRREV